MTTTKTYGAILEGTVTGYNLDDCLKQAKGEAGLFFGAGHAVRVQITSATPTAWNNAGVVEIFTAEYAARVDTSGVHNVREEEV